MDIFTTNVVSVLTVVTTSGALVAGAQFLPPLTQPDADSFPEFQHYAPLDGEGANVAKRKGPVPFYPSEARAFCQGQLDGVNCGCFADKASHIMQSRKPEVAGWSYEDKWELARSQASNSCS